VRGSFAFTCGAPANDIVEGDHIKVTASKYPFPTVCADRSSTDWFQSISRTLKWNERERQKSFVVVEENPAAMGDAPASGEEDGFDIDVIEDDGFVPAPPAAAAKPKNGGGASSDSSSGASEGEDRLLRQAHETLLQPDEAALGREKAREGARDQARAERAARGLAAGLPALRGNAHAGGSGIASPDRYLGAHPGRHVAFAGASGALTAGLHAPHAYRTSERERGRDDGRDDQRTPTTSGRGRGRGAHAHAHARSRSMEARHHHPRAFAVWGQDESESEGATSEDDV
jgi:NAD+ kinase